MEESESKEIGRDKGRARSTAMVNFFKSYKTEKDILVFTHQNPAKFVGLKMVGDKFEDGTTVVTFN